MPTDVRTHPDAPDLEQLQNVVVEPVTQEEIRRRREDGEVLVEDVVNAREDLDVWAPMSEDLGEEVNGDVGTAMYRLTQLFGTPQFPEFTAGQDISDRENVTYKYLFHAHVEDDVDDMPDEWLMTIHDWQLEVGVSVAEWREEDGEFTADAETALTALALAQNITTEPVQCEFEDIWY